MNLRTDTQQATFEGNVVVRLVAAAGRAWVALVATRASRST